MKNAFFRKIFSGVIDYLIAAVSILLSIYIGKESLPALKTLLAYLITFPIILIVLFYIFRIYNILWNYATFWDYIKLAFAVFVSVCAFYVVQRAMLHPFRLQQIILIFLIAFLFTFFRRFFEKSYRKPSQNGDDDVYGNIMVIGAGAAGSLFIDDVRANMNNKKCDIKCIIDDNPSKKGRYIGGAKIIGGCEEIIPAVKQYKIDIIVFAIPTCPADRKAAILNICQKTGCNLRTVPSLYQLIGRDGIGVSSLRKIEIEDLLGRDPIQLNVDSVMEYVKNKTVLVTGGGGSIGSELCRQVALHSPKRLIIFDIYENNAYDIQNELKTQHPDLDLIVLIGSVRDKCRLEGIFSTYKPQIVYHAAAHKHVPLMEDSPNESMKNNVFGTLNTAKLADKYGAEKFILISTDKAVNPTNIMGASKRICEMIVQTCNNHSKTEFVAVRFGNVLGSNGSVIPLFKKQIEQGGPVTVTDPNIIRYFMTIPEAVSLVLQAGATAKGGEIFVLDMGEPVKILDLAEKLISLSGYKPYEDIKIDFVGLRKGEKLYEEKLLSEEGLMRTQNRLIHIAQPIDIDEDKFNDVISKIEAVMSDDNSDIRSLVKQIVPTYSYASKSKPTA